MDRTTFSILRRQPHPLLFVALSGSHLYGFASPDSDYDLRGIHLAPPSEILGVRGLQRDTIEDVSWEDGVEDELVTHEAAKYFRLLLRNNGYVLEQIFSPFVLFDSGHLGEVREIAKTCITSEHSLHYKIYGCREWTALLKKPSKHVKRILDVFRLLMTGIHLMRTGEVEANILRLNEHFKLPYIEELVAQKIAGYEGDEPAAGRGLEFYTREHERMEHLLLAEAAVSDLPKIPSGEPALNDLLLRLRYASLEPQAV